MINVILSTQWALTPTMVCKAHITCDSTLKQMLLYHRYLYTSVKDVNWPILLLAQERSSFYFSRRGERAFNLYKTFLLR
jgi:hypothetical protein